MPRFTPSILFNDCWGSVGDLTFYHVDGVCYFKKRPAGAFPGTPGQLERLDVHRRALAAWRTVPLETQKVWNELAGPVISHRPPFDNKATISGYNLFVSAYHGFATLGDEHLPSPHAYDPFPVFSLGFLDAAVEHESDLRLWFHSFFPAGEDAGRYQVLMKIQLAQPGYGRKPGLMRNFLAEAPCSPGDGTVEVLVSAYRSRWELDFDAYQVHCRFVLLDRETGYRNQHRSLSFPINLR